MTAYTVGKTSSDMFVKKGNFGLLPDEGETRTVYDSETGGNAYGTVTSDASGRWTLTLPDGVPGYAWLDPGTGEPRELVVDPQWVADSSAATPQTVANAITVDGPAKDALGTAIANRGGDGSQTISGTGYASRRNKFPDFQVRGWNLGKINSATTTAFWTTNYDLPTIQAALDKMADFGANTVRITGSYTAYSQDAATHKSRTHAVWDYAKSKGLQIVYAWMNSNHDTLTGANVALYQAMVDDMIVGYAGDPMVLAWEIANELTLSGNTDHQTIAQGMASHLRTADPDTFVTGGGGGGQDIADVNLYDPLVDFHDIHLYANITSDLNIFRRSPLEQSLAAATKPVLIGEMGANTASTGSSRMGDENQAVLFYRAMRRWVDGTTMGCLVWNMFDDGDGTTFGMFASDHVTPRARLAPVLRYPDTSDQSALDFVRYREHPVLLDNFSRADSATTVGGPLIGSAPIVGQGTWGISGKRLYVATSDAGGSNFLVWDTKTGDIDLEVEFMPGPFVHVGLVLRYIDAGNFTICEYNQANGGFNFNHKVGGANAYTSSVYTAGIVGAFRLRMAVDGQAVTMFLHDKPVLWSQQINFSTAELTTTKHGIFVKGVAPNNDTGSKFTRVRASVPGRVF